MNTPTITQSIFKITKDKSTSDSEKIRALTKLFFENNTVATGACREAGRIMLAIEMIATESIIKQRG